MTAPPPAPCPAAPPAISASPFHADEVAAQHLAGGGPGGSGIRDFMPDQHRAFFASLPYVAIATTDDAGWPIATMLTGRPGFVHAPGPTTLRLDALPAQSDPLRAALRPGREVGVLGLDLATRRRNRANGRLASLDPRGITVTVSQSFGNCPKYIQRRVVYPAPREASPTALLTGLDNAARTLITQADTFFVASRSAPHSGGNGGVDISHRGGRPGFVRIEGDTLWVPDFPGNRYFNTLGNLLGEPRAALLFLDFERGDLLHLQGVADIDWSPAAAGLVGGAERYWKVRIARAWRRRAAVPLRWSLVEQAPATAMTGIWHQAAAAQPAVGGSA